MKTEKQLLEKLVELRAIANALPHPDYHNTKEIASSPRVKTFAQIKVVLDELKQFGYEEPEPEHPVKWVNELFQHLARYLGESAASLMARDNIANFAR